MRTAPGLCGKLPARGDFVRRGLPRGFVDPWEGWWEAALGLVRAGDAKWVEAWLAAPVWRFRLPAGACGTKAVLGVVLPSVDAANRYFPLTIAAVGPAGWDEGFLDRAEDAGRAAIAGDLAPDAVLDGRAGPAAGGPADGDCVFRTAGGPHVAPGERRFPRLPSPAVLRGMLNDDWRKDEA